MKIFLEPTLFQLGISFTREQYIIHLFTNDIPVCHIYHETLQTYIHLGKVNCRSSHQKASMQIYEVNHIAVESWVLEDKSVTSNRNATILLHTVYSLTSAETNLVITIKLSTFLSEGPTIHHPVLCILSSFIRLSQL